MPRKDALSRIDELFAKYASDKILDRILSRKDLLDNLIVKLTYHSDGIEGSTLTLKETAAVLLDGAEIKDRTVIEQMEAKNHKSAILYVLNQAKENREIDEEFIKHIHLVLMNGIIESAGVYRFHGVRIAGTNVVTANYLKVPDLMEDLIQKIHSNEGKSAPISFEARIHADFEKIHPFADGNGRVGRLLLMAMLLKRNIPPAIIEQNSKHHYYEHLENAQEHQNYEGIEKFIREAVENGRREIE